MLLPGQSQEGRVHCFPAGEPRLGSVGRPMQISRKPHFVNSQKCRQRWLWGTKMALLLHFICVLVNIRMINAKHLFEKQQLVND